ncbi:MAG: phage tail tape measure C-terminal domain-containing protein [Terracidiphilus sp.]|nr:phage tail tape measure C-terminal domain-containing protein [Terracidiphilus sp.]
MAIKIGNISISLTAETSSFQTEMGRASNIAMTSSKNIERSFNIMGAAIVSACGAAAGGLSFLVTKTEETVFAMQKMAQQSGMTVESFSKLALAAKMSGMPIDQMAVISTRVSKSAFAAASGNKQAAAAYKELGVSVMDSNGHFRTSDQIMLDLAKSLSQYKDSASKTAVETLLMGRSGAMAAEFMNVLATRFDEVGATAQRLGVVFDQNTAASAQKLHDNFIMLEEAGLGLSVKLLSSVAPALERVTNEIVDLLSNKDSMKTITKVGDDIAGAITHAGDAFDFMVQHAEAVKRIIETLVLIRGLGTFVPMVAGIQGTNSAFQKMSIASLNLAGNLLGVRNVGKNVFEVISAKAEVAAESEALVAAKAEALAASEALAQAKTQEFSQAMLYAQAQAADLAAKENLAKIQVAELATAQEAAATKMGMFADSMVALKVKMGSVLTAARPLLQVLTALAALEAIKVGVDAYSTAHYSEKEIERNTHASSSEYQRALADERGDRQNRMGMWAASVQDAQRAFGLTSDDERNAFYAAVQRRLENRPGYLPQAFSAPKAPGLPEGYDMSTAMGFKKDMPAISSGIPKVDELAKKLDELRNKAEQVRAALRLVGADPTEQRQAEIDSRVKTFEDEWKDRKNPLSDKQKTDLRSSITDIVNGEAAEKYQKSIHDLTETLAVNIEEQFAMSEAIGRSSQAMQDAAIKAKVAREMQKSVNDGGSAEEKARDAAILTARYRSEMDMTNRVADRRTADNQAQQLTAQQRLNAAIAQGVEAKRQAAIANEQDAVRAAFIDRGDTDTEALQAQLDFIRKKSDLEQQAADGERAVGFALVKQYDDQRTAILRAVAAARELHLSLDMRAVLAANKEASDAFFAAQDKAILATGSMMDGLHVALDQIARDTESNAQRVHDAFAQALSSMNDSIAKAMTGQKADFAGAFRGIADNLAKQSLQKLESTALNAMGFGGKPDGSKTNPLYVKNVDAFGGVGSSTSGLLGSLFGGSKGSTNGAGTASGSDTPSHMGSISSFIASLIPGFANGTDAMVPGMPSIVGEKGPELFIPPSAGAIVPNSRLKNGLGGGHTINIDARGSNDPAQTVAIIDRYMRHAAPQIVAHTMQAVTEKQRRRP